MMKNENLPHHNSEFRSANISLIAAILSELPEAVLARLEPSPERNRKLFVIQYPKSNEFEVNKLVQEYEDKTLTEIGRAHV